MRTYAPRPIHAVCSAGESANRSQGGLSECGVLDPQLPIILVVSMGHCNTGTKFTNSSFNSYIRGRWLRQPEKTGLFRFN